jgi:hypothetical protein
MSVVDKLLFYILIDGDNILMSIAFCCCVLNNEVIRF